MIYYIFSEILAFAISGYLYKILGLKKILIVSYVISLSGMFALILYAAKAVTEKQILLRELRH